MPPNQSGLSRRDFLRDLGVFGVAALGGLPAILSACNWQDPTQLWKNLPKADLSTLQQSQQGRIKRI